MNVAIAQLLAFLGLFLLLAPLWQALFRKLHIPDFLAFFVAGATIGFLYRVGAQQLNAYSIFTQQESLQLLGLLAVGVFIFFLAQNSIRALGNATLPHFSTDLLIWIAGSLLITGIVGLFILPARPVWGIGALMLAFLPFNAGPFLLSHTHLPDARRATLFHLYAFALRVEMLAMFAFGIWHTLENWLWYHSPSLWEDAAMVLGLVLLIGLLAFPWRAAPPVGIWKINWFDALFLLTGAFLLTGWISLVLVAMVLGAARGKLVGEAQPETPGEGKHFTLFALSVPFGLAGKDLVQFWQFQSIFWLALALLILVVVGVGALLVLWYRRKNQFGFVYFLAFLPRGELTLLMLWLAWQTGWLEQAIFAAGSVVVLLTTWLGVFAFTRPVKMLPPEKNPSAL